MERKSGYSLIFFDFVFFGEIFSDFKRGECTSVFFKDFSIVDTEESVFIGVSIVGFPFEFKGGWCL